MGKISQSIEKIKSLLKDDTTASVLKEYFELLEEHTGLLEKRLKDLEDENQRLKEDNISLNSKIGKVPEAGSINFVEARGAYFLRKKDGRFSETPYCPICKSPMSDVFGSTYHCSPCNYTWGYTRNDAGMIAKELEDNG